MEVKKTAEVLARKMKEGDLIWCHQERNYQYGILLDISEDGVVIGAYHRKTSNLSPKFFPFATATVEKEPGNGKADLIKRLIKWRSAGDHHIPANISDALDNKENAFWILRNSKDTEHHCQALKYLDLSFEEMVSEFKSEIGYGHNPHLSHAMEKAGDSFEKLAQLYRMREFKCMSDTQEKLTKKIIGMIKELPWNEVIAHFKTLRVSTEYSLHEKVWQTYIDKAGNNPKMLQDLFDRKPCPGGQYVNLIRRKLRELDCLQEA